MVLLAFVVLVTLGGIRCAWNAAGETGCRAISTPSPLPEPLKESSGIGFSSVHPDLLWSHNDGGQDAQLYALAPDGRWLGTLTLEARNRDWEDLSTARCEEGGCIYVADTGDNAEVRSQVELLRVADPGVPEGVLRLSVERFSIRLPEGPRDIEALFVLPGEVVYFVTKGRNHPVTVYRYPPPLRAGEEVILETVQLLSDGPLPIPFQITGAGASPDGGLVAIRSYQSLTFYRMTEGRLTPLPGGRVDLRTLQEPQGEAVALGPDAQVALTTEAGSFGGIAALRMLRCPVGR